MDSAERLTTKMRKLKAFSTKGPLLERSEAEEKEVTTIRQTEETSAKQSITVKQAIKTGSKSDGLHNSVGGKVNFGRANSNATQQQRKRSASLGTKPRTQISSRPHSSQSTGNNPSMGKNDDSRATKASLGLNGKPKSEKTSKTQRKKKAEARKKQEDLVNTMRYGSLIDDKSEMGCDFIMTIPELNKFMRTARQHRVLPTMLLYRRRRNGGDHFQALEFEDHLNQNFIVQETMDVHPKHARATG
ncbi:uncharacterized protein PHALS_02703 [Plasmopara halstedii]|uniref:Uncharacterized protein n=1 Tax=Plasmopara halstedii TaxID=4781 RepID=A0A0P1AYE5_PLAHL|nr:uncharacterized protein PHALS_02703 [Plasmopara halstedii]CEG46294.1 hypothetical protein PHALS_02703 [Plasmopara halstedii]|eukprot:XP_024582663.1 hypothetical protein PHALS_02703 [Plasmopara halstedii]